MGSVWISETMEGVCYLTFTLITLLLAIVSFAIGSTYAAFVPIGITLVLLSILLFILFLWRRKRRGDQSCLPCCASPEADSTCDRCLAAMLCLKKPDPEEREAEIQARLRTIISPPDPMTTQGGGTRASRWPQLQSLQKAIQNLQREYQYLERYPEVIPQLEECYMSLLRQESSLLEWMAGRDTPTHEDIKAMKTSLSRIKQQMRQALTTAETNNFQQLSELPSISERIYLSSAVGPQPPPYTVDDPLDSSTSSSFHELLSVQDLPTTHRQSIISPSSTTVSQTCDVHSRGTSSHNAPRSSRSRQHNVPQHGTFYRHNAPTERICSPHSAPHGLAYIPGSSSSNYSTGNSFPASHFEGLPPEDESDAPPSYEDAVSSTV